MNSGIRRLYEDLRSISVVVVYPPGEDRDVLLEQIKRIGCRLTIVWPFPPAPPPGADVILFQVSQELEGSSSWRATEVSSTLIALSDYETPTTLKLLLDTHAQGVITKPFRSAGILSTLVLARSAQGFQSRLQNKIRKLEDTIRARRQIEKAVRVLMDDQRMNEHDAYQHMRSRATSLRLTIAEVSAMVNEAHEAMEKLGLRAPPPQGSR